MREREGGKLSLGMGGYGGHESAWRKTKDIVSFHTRIAWRSHINIVHFFSLLKKRQQICLAYLLIKKENIVYLCYNIPQDTKRITLSA